MDSATWTQILACKKWGAVAAYSRQVTLWSPGDDIHAAIELLVNSAVQHLHCAMFGWDDDAVDKLFRDKWTNPALLVKLALDASQAAGVHERTLLKLWPADAYGSHLVIGNSPTGAISHLKIIVADDCWIGGSTNLSQSGEQKQTNQLQVTWDAKSAQEAQVRVSLIFDQMMSETGSLTHRELLGG